MSAGEGSPPGERGAPVRVGRAVWLSAATMASRVLGLLREQLFAVLVGANRFSDAFVVAFRIPNLLRDLFAEGALSSAFVPAFADAHRNRGAEAAWRLANTVVALFSTLSEPFNSLVSGASFPFTFTTTSSRITLSSRRSEATLPSNSMLRAWLSSRSSIGPT